MDLEKIKEIATPACRELDVKRLDVFGSVARGQGNSSSDVDFLVEFNAPAQKLSKRFFGLLHYLEDHLDCQIDLLTTKAMTNPYFRRQIFEDRVMLYES